MELTCTNAFIFTVDSKLFHVRDVTLDVYGAEPQKIFNVYSRYVYELLYA